MSTVTQCSQAMFATNPTCEPIMQAYCSNDQNSDNSGFESYLSKWAGDTNQARCPQYCERNLTAQPSCIFSNYQHVVDAYVRRYFLTDGHAITDPSQGSQIFDPNMRWILNNCSAFPGGCDQVLKQVCNGFTRANLQANPSEARLCGCFLDSSVYQKYTGSFGISDICDPICASSGTIKPNISSPQTCTVDKCSQSICVIDNVTISLLNNSTAGNITFASACSACAGNGGGCQCDISDISITAVESSIKDINFLQNCGNVRPNCFQSDKNGVPQQVDCSVLEPTATSSTSSPSSGISTGTILLIVGLVLFVIIIIIVIAIALRKRNVEPSLYGSRESSLKPPPGFGNAYA